MSKISTKPHQPPYQKAEQLVADELQKSGWRILARNYRKTGCELDIIACKMKSLIIVEVKYRPKTSNPSTLEELLPKRKKACLEKCARHFITETDELWESIRFDLALVFRLKNEFQKRKEPVFPPALSYFINVFEAN